jgi:hypothetical protein
MMTSRLKKVINKLRMTRSRAVGLALVVAATAGVSAVSSPAHASTCAINVGPPLGYYVCEYGTTLVRWPDGHLQYFVVGTDYAVWDSYQVAPYSTAWSNWRYLGGIARSRVTWYGVDWTRIGLNVIGTDGRYYCKRWTSDADWWPSQTGWALGSNCLP